MERIEGFRRSFAYDDWANREVWSTFVSAPTVKDPPASCVTWLAHIVAAERLWLARLQAQPSPLAVWPKLSQPELSRQLDELRSLWPAYLDELEHADLEREITYTNSRGERCTNRIEDVLEHVLFHGAYHRGQIASALRAAGLEPPCTDYIHATRNGLLE